LDRRTFLANGRQSVSTGISLHQKVFLTDVDAPHDACFRWRRLDHF
jgi:hypothetical protein